MFYFAYSTFNFGKVQLRDGAVINGTQNTELSATL
jgi:hypothetical protein